MNRREFLRDAALALAGMWALGPGVLPLSGRRPNAPFKLALLADAHLVDGDEGRPEARRLAQAVAEMANLRPPPDLVLFAGDLTHHGDPKALALGREILAPLPAPLLAVRGEGDLRPGSPKPWESYFGETPFLHDYQGVYFLGLDTVWQPESQAFALGEAQRRWLGGTLPRLDPEKPLVVLSHAPLYPIFRPWGQCTRDAAGLALQLARFRQVICLHGHVHHLRVRGEKPQAAHEIMAGGFPWATSLANRKPDPPNLSLPATAWPYPWALEGTPDRLRPGLGSRGCGWLSLSGSPGGWQVSACLWET